MDKDMTMKEVVDILPKDGTPIRIGNFELTYYGEFKYDEFQF